MSTRVRFAPSPTGPLHIGGLRTALFNYLYARKNKGVFILRIEDTDQNRYVPESEQYILDSLKWCGIAPDEGPNIKGKFGPYRQSERKEIYQKYINLLVEKGKAYLAFDSNEALSEARQEAEKKGETFQYGMHNRMSFKNSLTLDEEMLENLKNTTPYVIRLKVDGERNVSVFDEIRGNIQVNTTVIDDKILMKADGMPTYHFANVVDDQLMEITCVIRGEEWLPSLPLHQLIYEAFGWDTPKFMHLPLILKPTGKGKLSKRDGDKAGFPVFPLDWGKDTKGFKNAGFLPEALINYLALLGWNDGENNEIFTLSELEKLFKVERIQKGGARFDYEKARWINQQYLQKKTSKEILQAATIDAFKLTETFGLDISCKIIDLVKERLYTLSDINESVNFFISDPELDEKAIQKIKGKNPIRLLKVVENFIDTGISLNELKQSCMNWAKENNVSIGAMMQTLRVAIVGKLAGPDLFSIIIIVGKSVTLRRIKHTITNLNN